MFEIIIIKKQIYIYSKMLVLGSTSEMCLMMIYQNDEFSMMNDLRKNLQDKRANGLKRRK
jgi:hypothetical protein